MSVICTFMYVCMYVVVQFNFFVYYYDNDDVCDNDNSPEYSSAFLKTAKCSEKGDPVITYFYSLIM